MRTGGARRQRRRIQRLRRGADVVLLQKDKRKPPR